jgi:tRNA A-37 threonylcarbamoyl transferase component Bud32
MKRTRNLYTKIEQLGEKGKEARTFLVKNKFNCEYAMKTFRKNKSSDKIADEVRLQRICSDGAISPRIVDYDTEQKFIVMEKMDCHLVQLIQANNGVLTEGFQDQLLRLFKKLDKLKVFHGDANVLNYMVYNNKIFIIDFGFAKPIDAQLIKKLGTDKPNMELMLLGFVLKLKDMKASPSSYSVLKNHLSAEKIKQYKL